MVKDQEGRGVGGLALVPTPIGNMEDITLRSLRLLKECDLIACEDTRHSRPLLEAYGIDKPLVSYHDHNEQARSDDLIQEMREGKKICLISDAGMPGISDPGRIIVDRALDEGVPVTVLPGPSASVTCAVASGLVGEEGFVFLGFLPRKGKERGKVLEFLDTLPLTAVIYESPQRVLSSLGEFCQRWPNRQFAYCREWTKQYEELVRFQGKDFDPARLKEKGEFVLVLGPAPAESRVWSPDKAKKEMDRLLRQGVSRKDAASQLVPLSGWSKSKLYEISLNK